jgi:hypothetical protein
MNDEEPTEEERRDAEALARALERGQGGDAPEDALGTAAFLRFAEDGGALDPARADAILADAIARARAPSHAPRRGWWFGAVGLAAAALATWMVAPRATPPRAEVPPPPPSLLAAQLDAASGRGTAPAALETATAEYRATVYAALKERYQP